MVAQHGSRCYKIPAVLNSLLQSRVHYRDTLNGRFHEWGVTLDTPSSVRADSELEGCAWSPDGRLLAVVGGAGLYLFAFNS